MKKILFAATLLVCTASFAQNINPTVEVTNTYQGNPSEVHKPQLGMAVPDSLLRFDMDFGYEVFEKPYQGAYNFKPYMLAMKPDKDAFRGRKLYLRAGAGYSLHPQLDFVFSPEQKGSFQMSVYATHKSYFGKYNAMSPELEGDVYKIDKVAGKSFSGHDALTTAGFEGSYNWDASILSFGIGYYGLMTKDTLASRSYNAADFNLRFRSNRNDEKYLFFDTALKGRFGSNNFKYSNALCYGTPVNDYDIRESVFSLEGNVGPVFDYFHRLLVGFEAETCSYGSLFDGNAGRLSLVPKYQFEAGKWNFSLGVRIEKLFSGSQSDTLSFASMHTSRGRSLFPDVHVSYGATDRISLFADATGGSTLNTYSSLIARNHFFTHALWSAFPIMDNSFEKVNVKVGVRGNLWSRLQFELDAGAAVVGNGLVDGGYTLPVYSLQNQEPYIKPSATLPSVCYADYSVKYADLLLGLKTGKVRLDAALHLRSMKLDDEEAPGLLVPKFSTDIRAIYDFNPRVYAGVALRSASARTGRTSVSYDRSALWYYYYTLGMTDVYGNTGQVGYIYPQVKIPGYLDLGLLGGYQFSRKLGFWLESGNLLCESIQRNPFYSEKDLWITAGITLSL